jgi:methyltransferase family protein
MRSQSEVPAEVEGSARSFRELMASLEGMISYEEALFLRDAAAKAVAGCIVEIGSWRGKSAVALAAGLEARPLDERPKIYCIEPHDAFTGIYGGRFGPQDRSAFYRTMLSSGCAERVALVNLPSSHAVAGWREPIALLFIDGDHRYDTVRSDVDGWVTFLVERGQIIFDDALDVSAGPYRVIAELLESGKFIRSGGIGKIVALERTMS